MREAVQFCQLSLQASYVDGYLATPRLFHVFLSGCASASRDPATSLAPSTRRSSPTSFERWGM